MTIEPILLGAAGGSIAGFFAGYFMKKVLKIIAAISGGLIVFLIFLQYKRIIDVNTEQLIIQLEQSAIWISNTLQYLTTQAQGYDYSSIIAMSGFTGFFAVGFMKG